MDDEREPRQPTRRLVRRTIRANNRPLPDDVSQGATQTEHMYDTRKPSNWDPEAGYKGAASKPGFCLNTGPPRFSGWRVLRPENEEPHCRQINGRRAILQRSI